MGPAAVKRLPFSASVSPFLLLILSNALYWLSRELIRPSVSIVLRDRVTSTSLLGLLLSLPAVIPLLVAFLAGSLADRFGYHRSLLASSLCMMLSGLFYFSAFFADAIGPELYIAAISVGQLTAGLSWLGIWIATQALLAWMKEHGHAAGSDRSIRNVNVLVLSLSIGGLIGPVTGGLLLSRYGELALWIGYLTAATAHLFLSVLLYQHPQIRHAANADRQHRAEVAERNTGAATTGDTAERGALPRFRSTWQAVGGTAYGFVLIATAVMLFAVEVRVTFLPATLRHAGIGAESIGFIVTTGAIATMLVRLAAGAGYLPTNRLLLTAAALLSAVLGVAMLPVLPAGMSLITVSILLSLGTGIGEPVLISVVLERARRDRQGLATAGRLFVNRVAMFAAPISLGVAVQWFGGIPGYSVVAGGLALMSLFALRTLWQFTNHRNEGVYLDAKATTKY